MTQVPLHPSDALLGHVYGELSADEEARVKAHLEGCPECAATVAGYRAVRAAARALPRELPSDVGLQALLGAGQQAAAGARRRRRAVWTGSALGAAAAAALALLALRPTPTPPPELAVASVPSPTALPQDALAAAEPSATSPALKASSRQAAVGKGAATAKALAHGANAAASGDVAAQGLATGAAKKAEAAAAPGPLSARPETLGAVAVARAQALAPAARTTGAAGASAQEKPLGPGEAPSPRARDEARRQALLRRLPGASVAEALPLLFELCGLEARLLHPAQAQAACARVVEGYPGTPEAASAAALLEQLDAGVRALH
ncbi:MAG: zf-HC2 domain-containing protein [Myxococcaceae bacterium]